MSDWGVECPKVTINADAFLDKLNLQKIASEEMLNTRTRIAADTSAGKNAEGGGFRPYSRNYAIIKAASGRGTRVNLTWTGELLRSFVISNIPDGVQLGAQGQHAPSPKRTNRTKASAAKSKSAGGFIRSPGAKVARSAVGAKSTGGRAFKATRSSGGGGGTLSNAALVASLYAKGFVGWFMFGKKDIERIQKRALAEVKKNLKSLIDVK